MKFTFLLNKIELKKTAKDKYALNERRGFGDTVISAAMDNPEFKPDKSSKGKLVKLEIKNDPKLSDAVVRQQNDETWIKLNAQKQSVDKLKDKGVSKSFKDIVGKWDAETVRVMEAFVFFYSNIYKTSPEPVVKYSTTYDVKSLAKAYTIYVIESGKPDPTQNELSKQTGVDQSTWSRTFSKVDFWTTVTELAENIWQTSAIANKNIERISTFKMANKVKGEDDLSEKKRKVYDTDENSGEREIISNAESSLYANYSKERLIKEIIKLRPLAKRSELELENEDDLRSLYASLKAK